MILDKNEGVKHIIQAKKTKQTQLPNAVAGFNYISVNSKVCVFSAATQWYQTDPAAKKTKNI